MSVCAPCWRHSEMGGAMTLEILYVETHVDGLLERVREVTDVPVTTRLVGSGAEAVARGMSGSPTLLVNSADPPLVPARPAVVPDLRRPLGRAAAGGAGAGAGAQWADPRRIAGRRRARRAPGDPACVRGQRPATGRGRGRVARGAARVARIDAIRLGADGEMVAYPFSATPTPHLGPIPTGPTSTRCARSTRRHLLQCSARTPWSSRWTGRPVRRSASSPRGSHDLGPRRAVVFVGADPCGGPSADCCCDYLNFFADRGAAQAWSAAHPGCRPDPRTGRGRSARHRAVRPAAVHREARVTGDGVALPGPRQGRDSERRPAAAAGRATGLGRRSR